MGSNGQRTASARSWRTPLAVVAVSAGLLLGQPAVATSQAVDAQVAVNQLDASIRQTLCQVVTSIQAAFVGFPAVTAIFTSLLRSFGCSGGPPSGTTTTTISSPTTTTTISSPTTTTTISSPTTTTSAATTTSTMGTGPTTTMGTGPTTTFVLPPCPSTTTTSTTLGQGTGTTTTTAPCNPNP